MKVVINEQSHSYASDFPEGWKFSSGDPFKFPVDIDYHRCFVKLFRKPVQKITGWDLLLKLKGKNLGNLPRIHDIQPAEINGAVVHYVFYEYVEGENLDQILANAAPLEMEKLASGIFGALGSLHSAGFWCADFCEKNIYRDSHGRFMLLDLDSCIPLSVAPRNDALGSKDYWSPVYHFYRDIIGYDQIKTEDLPGNHLNILQLCLMIFRIFKFNQLPKDQRNYSGLLYKLHLMLFESFPDSKELFKQVFSSYDPAKYDFVSEPQFLVFINEIIKSSPPQGGIKENQEQRNHVYDPKPSVGDQLTLEDSKRSISVFPFEEKSAGKEKKEYDPKPTVSDLPANTKITESAEKPESPVQLEAGRFSDPKPTASEVSANTEITVPAEKPDSKEQLEPGRFFDPRPEATDQQIENLAGAGTVKQTVEKSIEKEKAPLTITQTENGNGTAHINSRIKKSEHKNALLPILVGIGVFVLVLFGAGLIYLHILTNEKEKSALEMSRKNAAVKLVNKPVEFIPVKMSPNTLVLMAHQFQAVNLLLAGTRIRVGNLSISVSGKLIPSNLISLKSVKDSTMVTIFLDSTYQSGPVNIKYPHLLFAENMLFIKKIKDRLPRHFHAAVPVDLAAEKRKHDQEVQSRDSIKHKAAEHAAADRPVKKGVVASVFELNKGAGLMHKIFSKRQYLIRGHGFLSVKAGFDAFDMREKLDVTIENDSILVFKTSKKVHAPFLVLVPKGSTDTLRVKGK